MKTRSRRGVLIAAIAGLVLGSIFVAVGLWVRSSTQPINGGVVVAAEVVDVSQRTDSDGDTMYTPIVNYVDPSTGQSHQLAGSVSSSSRPTVGEQKEVSLIPGDPTSARVLGPTWFPWIFIAVGVAAILVTITSVAKASVGDNHTSSMADEPDSPRRPGFHPDPSNDDQLRYWDGARWTDDVAPQIFDD